MAWWCLLLDQVWGHVVKPKGLSVNTSKQSNVETHCLKSQNDSSRFLLIVSLSSHSKNISSFSDDILKNILLILITF